MDLFVAADDRTGAFETAAALADHGAGPVPVLAWPARPAVAGVSVIDLACRHAIPADAAARAADLPLGQHNAHKIDSTLRGNWADELAARSVLSPVLLIPALPAFGRTCVDGVVLEHGRPVHEGSAGSDVRRKVETSRPVDALRSAGMTDVGQLADPAALADWLANPSGVRVADAVDDDMIMSLVQRWVAASGGSVGVLLGGTSAVIGAAASALGGVAARAEFPRIDGPVLVACGSVHPAARAQLAVAERAGFPVTYLADEISAEALRSSGALVLATEIPVGDVGAPMAVAASATLARGVTTLRERVHLGALVILGGDSAAAVLGASSVEVHGSVDAGTAWARVDGFDHPVVTRSGGFGSDHALVDLIRRALER